MPGDLGDLLSDALPSYQKSFFLFSLFFFKPCVVVFNGCSVAMTCVVFSLFFFGCSVALKFCFSLPVA